MRISKEAAVSLVPSLMFSLGAPAWSASSDPAAPINTQIVPANPDGPNLVAPHQRTLTTCHSGFNAKWWHATTGVETEGGRKMKVLGNAAAFLIVLSVMGGIILAQRDYQNSWREPSAIHTSATIVTNAGTLHPADQYKVVMR